MHNRPVRFRGTEYPVLERFSTGGRSWLAVAKIGSAGRRAFQVFDPAARAMRALHVLPNNDATYQRIRALQRLTQGDNEILQIIEIHRQQNEIYIVLPWVDGFNLRSILLGIRDRGRPRIATPEAVRLVKGLAHMLHHVHRHPQIIHGDIKPANLILTRRTSLVLIDYGNAWQVERTAMRLPGDAVSPVYAAPELVRGDERVDSRADQFSLGVVLYEILTGRLPYDGHGGKVGLLPEAVRSRSCLIPASELSPERKLLSPRIWKPVDSLLATTLAIEANDRFATSGAWLDAWNTVMTEIKQAKQRATPNNLLVRMIDWMDDRLNRAK